MVILVIVFLDAAVDVVFVCEMLHAIPVLEAVYILGFCVCWSSLFL